MAIVITQPGGNAATGTRFRASFYAFLNNQLGIFDVSYLCGTSTGGGATAGEIAKVLQTEVEGAGLPNLMTNQATLLGCKVSFYPPDNHLGSGIATTTTATAGGTQPLPTQVRGLIAWSTGQSGRAFRGRSYVPFPDASTMLSTGFPSAGYVSGLQTLATVIMASGTVLGATGSSTISPGIFHRKAAKSGFPLALSINLITGGVARTRWATIRRSSEYGRLNAGVIT